MKKLYIYTLLIISMMSANVKAQGYFSENMFNHLAIGVKAGTPGLGVDLATTVGNHFQLRAGYSAFPSAKMSTTLALDSREGSSSSLTEKDYKFDGKLNFGSAKILIDYLPFKSSSFHITVGAYIGSSKIIKVNNTEDGSLMDITTYNNSVAEDQQLGVVLGDYLLKPNEEGNIESRIKVSGFKPYVGIGFGRAVPRKNRVGFMFELGCQLWGTPKIYTF